MPRKANTHEPSEPTGCISTPVQKPCLDQRHLATLYFNDNLTNYQKIPMALQLILATGIRLFAIWALLTSIEYFLYTSTAMLMPKADQEFAAHFAIGVTYALIAVLLWLFPMHVARRMLPPKLDEYSVSLSAYDLARVGTALIGVWLIAKALPEMLMQIYIGIFVHAPMSVGTAIDTVVVTNAQPILSVLVAALLIWKSGAIASVVVPDHATR